MSQIQARSRNTRKVTSYPTPRKTTYSSRSKTTNPRPLFRERMIRTVLILAAAVPSSAFVPSARSPTSTRLGLHDVEASVGSSWVGARFGDEFLATGESGGAPEGAGGLAPRRGGASGTRGCSARVADLTPPLPRSDRNFKLEKKPRLKTHAILSSSRQATRRSAPTASPRRTPWTGRGPCRPAVTATRGPRRTSGASRCRRRRGSRVRDEWDGVALFCEPISFEGSNENSQYLT